MRRATQPGKAATAALRNLGVLAVALLFVAAEGLAQEKQVAPMRAAKPATGSLPDGIGTGRSLRGVANPAAAPRRVVVSIPDRKLAVVEDGRVTKVYSVGVGADDSPSPTGTLKVVKRLTNPAYYQPGVVIPPGKSNPLGTRWLGLSAKGYGIHGTNQPHSIGKNASHGCIRLRNRDIEELFERLRAGDVVELYGERTEETAQIFGGATAPKPPQPAVSLAAMQLIGAGGEQK